MSVVGYWNSTRLDKGELQSDCGGLGGGDVKLVLSNGCGCWSSLEAQQTVQRMGKS
jgi:hypothetical protein